MKIRTECLACFVAAILLAPSLATNTQAQRIAAELSTTTLPTNPNNGFTGFSFGGLAPLTSAPGGGGLITAVDDPFLSIDSTEFGGVGVDFVDSVDVGMDMDNQFPQNFDAADAFWEIRLRVNTGNAATAFRTTLIDVDPSATFGDVENIGGGNGGSGFDTSDEHVYEFDISGLPLDEFVTITSPLLPGPDSSFLFTQGGFGDTPGDTEINPGLQQIQIQSVFGVADRLFVDVEFARVVVIPEPATIGLMLGGLALVASRRRC